MPSTVLHALYTGYNFIFLKDLCSSITAMLIYDNLEAQGGTVDPELIQ